MKAGEGEMGRDCSQRSCRGTDGKKLWSPHLFYKNQLHSACNPPNRPSGGGEARVCECWQIRLAKPQSTRQAIFGLQIHCDTVYNKGVTLIRYALITSPGSSCHLTTRMISWLVTVSVVFCGGLYVTGKGKYVVCKSSYPCSLRRRRWRSGLAG